MLIKVTDEIEERIKVPGLIGRGCQYASLPSFLLGRSQKTDMGFINARQRMDNLQVSIESLETMLVKESNANEEK